MPRRDPAMAVLLSLATAGLAVGVQVPIVEIEKPLADDVFSVLTGILALLRGGLAALGLLVLGFSVVFPAVKLAVLWAAWWRPERASSPRLSWVAWLGKWSMLDVYVVAILFGAIRLGIIAGVEPRFGVYVFAGSVLTAMLATHLARRAHPRPPLPSPPRGAAAGLLARSVSLAALLSFVAGMLLPLMVVEKWLFWRNDYSLLSSLAAMAEEGEIGLLTLVIAFALALPATRLVGLLAVRLQRAPRARLVRGVLVLDEWAMADVFTLALLVVVAKAGTMASVAPRAGLWLLVASGIFAALDAELLRRQSPAPARNLSARTTPPDRGSS